jgi:hypothetical protein
MSLAFNRNIHPEQSAENTGEKPMSPRVKYGLIVGAIGFIINICASTFSGICGPFMALFAGAIAGLLTGREEVTASQGQSAQAGAVSGAIAGTGTLVSQLIAGVVVLAILPELDVELPFGQLPQAGNTAEQIGYWIGGLGAGFCFGLVGLVLAAGAGAAVAYFMYKPQPPAMPQT